MSAATPSSSTPEASSPANQVAQSQASQEASASTSSASASTADQLILEYLRSRGYLSAERAFSESLVSDPNGKAREVPTLTADELIKRISSILDRAGDTAVQTALKDITSLSSSTTLQSLLSSIGPGGTEEILTLDPTDKQEGYRELEAWVDGSLDMYKVRLAGRFSQVPYTDGLYFSLNSDQYYSPFSVIFTLT